MEGGEKYLLHNTRAQLDNIAKPLELCSAVITLVNIPERHYWRGSDATLITGATDAYRACEIIPVNQGEHYVISGASNYLSNVYFITDANDVPLSIFPDTNLAKVNYYNIDFVIPSGGAKLYVNNYNNETILKKYTGGIVSKTPKIGVVGDSVSASYAYTNNHWHDYLNEIDGFSINNLSYSGTGYRKGYATNSDFVKKALTLDIDCDIVVVLGSFNDISEISGGFAIGTLGDTDETASVHGCIFKTIDNIRNRCPDALILVITPLPWGTYKPTDLGSTNQILYVNAILETADYCGVDSLDLFRVSNFRPWDAAFYAKYNYPSGTAHPNGVGHKKFVYPKIKNKIKSLLA